MELIRGIRNFASIISYINQKYNIMKNQLLLIKVRLSLLVSLLFLVGGSTSYASEFEPIVIYVGYIDPTNTIPELGKGPEYVPSVVQDGYEITFLAIHPAYTLNIVANGVVVYSVALSPYTTSIVLPSWLSGQYEIQLRPDDYYYLYGYIEL